MTGDERPSLLVVVGPTGTGKSTLAARLAHEWQGEVVSADSVQVYRHFDAGSGKPTGDERALAPHHLIDIADPLAPLEANVWAELARSRIKEIRERGKIPVVCGGTFLWVRALVFGLAEAPPGDEAIRARHQAEAAAEGREALHRRLAAVDAKSAERLHPNDLIRVSRALEVFELTGRPLSVIQAEHGFRQARYDVRMLGVQWDRDAYDQRLASRVRQMLDSGWKKEVEDLLARGYASARAMDAVGYRQVKEAVQAAENAPADEELAEQITRVTRIFARRQRTWLRAEPVQYVSPTMLGDQAELATLAQALKPALV